MIARRLSPEEECELLGRARAGDRDAEADLVVAHLPLARAIAWRYWTLWQSAPLQDLEQEAALALLVAVRRYEQGRGARLATYATHWIRVRVARACRRWWRQPQEPADGYHGRALEQVGGKEPGPVDLDVRGLLAELPPARRRCLELAFGFEGPALGGEDLAAALGVSTAAAHKTRARALEQLRGLAGNYR